MSTPIETFENLLKKNESDTVDFKECNYTFEGATSKEKMRKRAEFIKDIISMVNTPRDESAYIVLGVRCYPDGKKELKGLDSFLDDADLHSKFETICHPHPRFKYEPVNPVTSEGQCFAYIEIPADKSIGPIVPIKDVDHVLRIHAVYHRRNSQNAMADVAEQKQIYKWFRESIDLRPQNGHLNPLWEKFLSAVHGFEASRKYVLITSPGIVEQGGPAENLANIPWLLVADFDHESQDSGLLFRVSTPLSEVVSLHRITIDIEPTISPTGAIYWYFARGIAGRTSTQSLGAWIDWQKKYAKDIQKRLTKFAGAINSPVTIIALWAEPSLRSHLDSLLSSVLASFGESAEMIIVSSTYGTCNDIADKYAAANFEIPFKQLFHGLGFIQVASLDMDRTVFPSSSGADITIDEQTVAWLQEEMTIVHKNVGLSSEDEHISNSTFLRGREISWFELGLHLDVDRDIMDKVKKAIRHDLESRSATRINLYHAPGAGGSTLARRLLWDFKNEFPSIVLRRSQPSETVERIQNIFSETTQPVLIMADGSRISDRQSDELYKLLAASNTPFVMLQVLRRFKAPQTSQRTFFLDQELSSAECARFAAVLSRERPRRKAKIEAAAGSVNGRYRSPFYL